MHFIWKLFLFCFSFTYFIHSSPLNEQSLATNESPIAQTKIADNDDDEDNLFNYEGRIVGGLITSILNFPYQVSLQYKGQHICGGAIIRPNVIISAAHCCESTSLEATSYQVRVGSTRHSTGGQLYNVQRIFRHESFSFATNNYDIALLQLEQELIYSQTVQPIQLANVNGILSKQTELLVSGWGLTSETGHPTTLLNYVDVKLISQEICMQNYKYIVTITNEMFCAGHYNGGKDACQGDSGGPLVAKNAKDEVTLYGIVSWGVGCAQSEYPGVYISVSALKSWIDDKLANIK